jgi:membrane fusion protein, multidrug efflux system
MEKKPSNKKFIVILGSLLILGSIYGISKYLHAQVNEETDDAQVQKKMSPIISRVSGYIAKVYVQDNDLVKKGDTLFVIDDKDFLVKIAEAEAAVVAAESSFEASKADIIGAEAGVAVSDANLISAGGNIATAKIKLTRAQNDFERYSNLYKNHSITKQQFEQAEASRDEAQSQLNVLISQQNAAKSQKNVLASKNLISGKQSQVAAANINKAKALLEAAKLNLSYTIVTAASDGQVSKIDLQPGQLIQMGQALFFLVNNNDVWVNANFKETQLAKMKVGQAVTIKIDAFDGEIFEGELVSFSPATGSQFSILPPDNATGNFVKTIQRLPVKIAFKDTNDKEKIKLLRSGMNAEVDVHLE